MLFVSFVGCTGCCLLLIIKREEEKKMGITLLAPRASLGVLLGMKEGGSEREERWPKKSH